MSSRSDYRQSEEEKMTCPICGGRGLKPFVKPDGSVSKYAKIYCECHETNQPEHYHPIRPEDIDFTVSYSCWRSLCQEHGWPDPGPDRMQG